MDNDIRWHQRFSNYRKAFKKLSSAIDLIQNQRGDAAGPKFDKQTAGEIEDV